MKLPSASSTSVSRRALSLECPDHTATKCRDSVSQRPQHVVKQRVVFLAITAAARAHELVVQRRRIEIDRNAE